MLRVVVCDDDAWVREALERQIRACAQRWQVYVDVEHFEDGESFLSQKTDKLTSVDLLFLDVEMPGLSGIELARKLRSVFCDFLIVYVSGHTQYFRQMVETQPFSFLEKPVTDEAICSVMERAMEWNSQKRATFRISDKKGEQAYILSEVLYFESCGRQVDVVTTRGRDSFYRKLSDIIRSVHHAQFFSPHKSYYINCDHIRHISYQEIEMQDGKRIRIPEQKRKTVRERYGQARCVSYA